MCVNVEPCRKLSGPSTFLKYFFSSENDEGTSACDSSERALGYLRHLSKKERIRKVTLSTVYAPSPEPRNTHFEHTARTHRHPFPIHAETQSQFGV